MKKSSVLILLVFAILIGIFVGRCSNHSSPTEKKPMYWVDTMEPTIHYPNPGKSRMGMELVPVYPDEGQTTDQSTVRISPTVINNLGVRTAPVTQGELARHIETVGYVEPNENKISHIHSYADGWVKKLFVKTVGEPVKSDQAILQLYSPTLVSAQEEYLIALGSNNQALIDASEKRLEAFHISDQQIQQLKSTRKASQLVDIYPHQNGVITELNIREGMRVTPDTEMMSIVDLSSIWMIAQVFEKQANWVKVGEKAEARIASFPEKTWQGNVEYIYPQVDPTTRTLKVRFRFTNPDGVLKPNMYATITLFSEPVSNVMSIPLEALIQSSSGDHVIVKLSDGQFQARAVRTGIESGDRVEILSGLKVGEIVVISGQFLIDSETNLKAGLERIEENSDTTKTQQASSASSTLIVGKGIIKKIDTENNSVTLQHEAIPTLNWPEMTMDFMVDKSVALSQFKLGDQIQFGFTKDNKNNYVIMEIKKLSNK